MSENIGKLLLRLTVGGMLLFHGIYKLQHGIGTIKGMVAAHHLPDIVAYGVYIGEVIAPLLLILGFYSRIWAGIIVFNMLTALWLTHFQSLHSFGAHGAWGAEAAMFYLMGALSIVLLGSGVYAVKRD